MIDYKVREFFEYLNISWYDFQLFMSNRTTYDIDGKHVGYYRDDIDYFLELHYKKNRFGI